MKTISVDVVLPWLNRKWAVQYRVNNVVDDELEKKRCYFDWNRKACRQWSDRRYLLKLVEERFEIWSCDCEENGPLSSLRDSIDFAMLGTELVPVFFHSKRKRKTNNFLISCENNYSIISKDLVGTRIFLFVTRLQTSFLIELFT